jgi:hypothetical protein
MVVTPAGTLWSRMSMPWEEWNGAWGIALAALGDDACTDASGSSIAHTPLPGDRTRDPLLDS